MAVVSEGIDVLLVLFALEVDSNTFCSVIFSDTSAEYCNASLLLLLLTVVVIVVLTELLGLYDSMSSTASYNNTTYKR